MKTTQLPSASTPCAIFLSALTGLSLALLPSCKEEDPSYEKEAIKLSAEKAVLEERLETANKKLEALQAKVKNIQAQRDAMEAKPAKIDVEKIKLGFAKAVSELQAQIEQKHPEYTVESVTFQKMKLPGDYPFTSGVITTLRSRKTGAKQLLYWEAQGNIEGKWRFANKKKPATSVADNSSTPSTPNTQTPQKPDKPIAQAPPRPQQPRPPVRRPPVSNGNTHVIDWGRLK